MSKLRAGIRDMVRGLGCADATMACGRRPTPLCPGGSATGASCERQQKAQGRSVAGATGTSRCQGCRGSGAMHLARCDREHWASPGLVQEAIRSQPRTACHGRARVANVCQQNRPRDRGNDLGESCHPCCLGTTWVLCLGPWGARLMCCCWCSENEASVDDQRAHGGSSGHAS